MNKELKQLITEYIIALKNNETSYSLSDFINNLDNDDVILLLDFVKSKIM